MFLSIIIPVYKVEKYIYGTLASIYGQNADDSEFEVIVVNDGTPDDSMKIVRKFSDLHSNLSIIEQKNQGLSVARNSGMKVARGDYIWFVDSDDSVATDCLIYLKKLLGMPDKVDIWCFDLLKKNELDGTIAKENFFFKTSSQSDRCNVSKYDFGLKTHMAPAQRFLFRRNFLNQNNLTFYPGIIHEDDDFIIRSILVSRKICYSCYSPYLYLIRQSGNIMSTAASKSMESLLKIMESWCKILQEKKMKRDDEALLKIYVFEEMGKFLRKSRLMKNGDEHVEANHEKFRKISIEGFKGAICLWNIRKAFRAFMCMIRFKFWKMA